jgi:alkylmercury lyase
MSSIKHGNDAGLAGFVAERDKPITVTYAVIGLTNFGEHPVQSTRLAEVLGRPVSEAEALARQWGWPGTRAENGLVTVNPERAKSATRRHVRIGDRRDGVTGCAGDILHYAPLVRPSLQVEETCPVTGTLIRIVFTPSRVEHVDPAGAVLPMADDCQSTLASSGKAAGDIEDLDASMCVQSPFFASAEAAQGWLDAHPGGRVLPVRKVRDLSIFRDWRDRMSALLNLDRESASARGDARRAGRAAPGRRGGAEPAARARAGGRARREPARGRPGDAA